jgi:hypothetical protein
MKSSDQSPEKGTNWKNVPEVLLPVFSLTSQEKESSLCVPGRRSEGKLLELNLNSHNKF